MTAPSPDDAPGPASPTDPAEAGIPTVLPTRFPDDSLATVAPDPSSPGRGGHSDPIPGYELLEPLGEGGWGRSGRRDRSG